MHLSLAALRTYGEFAMIREVVGLFLDCCQNLGDLLTNENALADHNNVTMEGNYVVLVKPNLETYQTLMFAMATFVKLQMTKQPAVGGAADGGGRHSRGSGINSHSTLNSPHGLVLSELASAIISNYSSSFNRKDQNAQFVIGLLEAGAMHRVLVSLMP